MASAPRASFLAWVGVAKQTIYATLGAAVTGGSSTTLTLANTVGTTPLASAGATYTAFIVDGSSGESVACSGNLSGGNITVATPANNHSINALVYFQLTASVGPTAYIRPTKIDFADAYAQLADKGYRAAQADEFGVQQGMRVGNFSLEADLFADDFGYILGSFFGAYDYTATSGSLPTTYKFSPQNTGSGQPAPYLFYWFNPGAQQTYVVANSIVGTLDIDFDPGALIHWSATAKGFAMSPVATPTPTFSTFTPVASRVGAASIGGSTTQDLQKATYSFKRQEFGEINTIQGIQDPLAIFSGPVALQTKFSVVQADATQYLDYVNATQPTFDVKALKGTTTAQNGIEIHCNQANYEQATPVISASFVTLDGSFTAIANTTDASTAGTGYSPAAVTLSVGLNTGSTQY